MNQDSNRGRGFGFNNRGRSRSRGFRSRGVRNNNPVVVHQPVENQPTAQKNEPQKQEAKASLDSYDQKKKDPSHSDIKLETFFTEWIEVKNQNIVGELNDFEGHVIDKISDKMGKTIDVSKLKTEKKIEIKQAITSGLVLTVASRLLNTASNTQINKDEEMIRLAESMENTEIPRFWNATLSNVGKFTDEVFGNFRIQSPITKAKQYICKSMHLAYDELSLDYVYNVKSGTERKTPDEIISRLNKVGADRLIFNDADSADYLKHFGRKEFDRVRKINFTVKDAKDRNIYLSFPYIELEDKVGIRQVAEYLQAIGNMDSDLGSDVKNQRDYLAATMIFCVANEGMLTDINQTIANWNAYFDDDKFSWFKDMKIIELFKYTNLVYMGDYLTTRHLLSNGRKVLSFYNDSALPYLKKNMHLVVMDNGKFGKISQLIEPKENLLDDPVQLGAITKFKDKNSSVFGAIFGFTKNLKFKRDIFSTLSASKDNILDSHIKNDFRYKRN